VAETLEGLNQTQKVAALLIALGPATASEILKNVRDEGDVERIALEIASMKKVGPDVLSLILEEFYVLFEARGHLSTGGVSYAREVLLSSFGEERADKILDRLVATMQTQPFEFFNNADAMQLASSFQNENPQLVALVLAYLNPEKAAAILSALSPEMQVDVASRVAEMDRTNPDVLRDVERIMEMKFSSFVTSGDFTKAGGIESLAEILNYSDRATEKAILDTLEVSDPDVAESVRELMFVFEDIQKLDDRIIQRILREVETKDLAMALKGSKNEVKERIFANMSERASAMLKDDMDYMGPVRAKDVQEKQSHIVGIIRVLESSGEITINRGTAEEDSFID
jgi:flagellar motor switch protein FliG